MQQINRKWLMRLAGPLALVIALALLVLAFAPGSASLTAADEGAQVRLSADRRWTLLPDGCVTVSWTVSGVREVYLDGEGVTGDGSRLMCAAEEAEAIVPILRIVTSSGTERFYALHVPALTGRGEFWLALMTIGLLAAAHTRRQRLISGTLLLAAAGIGVWLIWQFINPAPLVIRTAERGGFVSFSATPIRLPDDCTTLNWAVEGIQQVRLNGEAVTGQGQRRLCATEIDDLYLTVTFRDGSQRDYRFPPNRLLYPAGLLALCGAVLLVALAADVWRGARIRLASRLSRYDAVGLIAAFGMTALIYGYLISQTVQTTDDYWVHLNFAAILQESGTTPLPHFLFQALVVTLAGVIPGGNLTVAGVFVGTVAYASITALAYVLLRQALGQTKGWLRASLLAGLALAICVMDVAGLPVPGYDNYTYRLAYISLQPLHNPTYPLVRPFALLQFIYFVRAFRDDRERTALFPATLIGLLALLAKPSYLIALIPVAGLAAIWRLGRGQAINWPLLGATVGAGIPPLGWLYYYNYASPTGDAGIRLAPFAVYVHFAPEPWYAWLGPFMLLSVAFPLWVYAADFAVARRNGALNLAWLTLIVAQGYYLLLTEGVPSAGNFRWGAQIALFILCATSLVFFAQRVREAGWNRRFRIGAALFAWHVLSGVYAYAAYLAWVWSWIRPA